MDLGTVLGTELKNRNNFVPMGIQIGTVSQALPELKIKIDGTIIELEKNQLIVANDLLKHNRKFNLTTTFKSPSTKVGSIHLVSEHRPKDNVLSLVLTTKPDGTQTCEIEFVDELNVGDKVMLIPSTDEQTYYVMDKAVELP